MWEGPVRLRSGQARSVPINLCNRGAEAAPTFKKRIALAELVNESYLSYFINQEDVDEIQQRNQLE